MSIDTFITEFDLMLRSLSHTTKARRPLPAAAIVTAEPTTLSASDTAESIRLMRVNHVGEVCAQALYQGHGLATSAPELKTFFHQAAAEERDHLAWTQTRLSQLGGRTSFLNPLWYVGAFALGYAAGKVSDQTSLALMAETEDQVEAHLEDHLNRLPPADTASRAIVAAMQQDEAQHALAARRRNPSPLPRLAKLAMRAGAQLMTGTARYV